ncbi:Glutathione transferase GST 23 [Apostasia shenzhenica]|uniref:glutathione transferase n=1 Tax=Apostasia shenzhenica TaxID=1088818 RepID=A0A2I0BHE2_9ASPA|nr:Glutathione transferase GST 23 [Apostasia shenzhenica]
MEETKQDSAKPPEPEKNIEEDNSSSSSANLKLFGSWASSYTHRVQLALKIKNLAFAYVEEDLTDKSPSLLLHNPIYKKVPVLLAGGRPIPESLLILHFLDEAFPGTSPILPADPFDRAIARFWAHFAEDRLGPAVAAVFSSSGEAQNAAVCRVHDELRLIEAELQDGAFAGRRFFAGDRIGLLDIVLGCGSYWLGVFEEVAGVKLVDAGEFPRFHAWLSDFEEQEVKAIIPPFDKLLTYARGLRQMLLDPNGDAGGVVAGSAALTV